MAEFLKASSEVAWIVDGYGVILGFITPQGKRHYFDKSPTPDALAGERSGSVVLVAGVATVNDAKVTANSRIFLEIQEPGGTIGHLHISARTPGTSFTITSSSSLDTSTVAYLIIEPEA